MQSSDRHGDIAGCDRSAGQLVSRASAEDLYKVLLFVWSLLYVLFVDCLFSLQDPCKVSALSNTGPPPQGLGLRRVRLKGIVVVFIF